MSALRSSASRVTWPPRRDLAPAALGAVATGVLLGGLAVGYQLRHKTTTELAIAAVIVALVTVIVGNPRRVMIAAIVFDIPLEWGKYLFWNQTQANVGAIAGLDVSVTTLALLCLYVMWALDRGGTRPRLRLRPALPLIAYVSVNVASLFVARNKTLSAYELALLTQTLLLFVYVVSTVRTRADVHFLVTTLMAGLLVESALILFIYATGSRASFLGLRNRVNPADYGGRVGGTIGSPNTAAAYLCLTLSLAIGVLASKPTAQLRRLTLVALSLGVLALIITGSRGGWVAFAISASLVGVWMIRRHLIVPRAGVLVVLSIVALSVPFWGTVTQRVVGNDNGSAASRISLMKLASEMISAHPLLGLGVNNVGVAIPEYAGPQFDGQWLYTVHNKYLLVWAEAGIGALLAFIWFLVGTLRRGLRSARSSDRTLAPLAVGLAAGIAGQLVHFGVDLFQSKPDVEGLWLAAALLAAIELILLRERRAQSAL